MKDIVNFKGRQVVVQKLSRGLAPEVFLAWVQKN